MVSVCSARLSSVHVTYVEHSVEGQERLSRRPRLATECCTYVHVPELHRMYVSAVLVTCAVRAGFQAALTCNILR